MEEMTSDRREVLLRREASRSNSRGEAPYNDAVHQLGYSRGLPGHRTILLGSMLLTSSLMAGVWGRFFKV